MGKKKGGSMPSAPDYTKLALVQAAIGKQNTNEQTLANRPTQIGTEGSLTWSQDPTTGAWTQTSQLGEPQQDLYNAQLGNQQQLAGMFGNALGGYDTSQIGLGGAPGMPSGPVDYSSLGQIPQVGQFNQQATDLFRSLGQPDLDRAQAARRAAMAARGISDVTSQAGTNLEAQLADQTNRFGMEAAQRGIQQGNVMFGQGMQGYQQGAQNLNNQFQQGMGLHQQGVSDILGERSANLGQLQGLYGLGRAQSANPSFAGFNEAGLAPTPNLMGAADKSYEAQVAQANAKKKGGLLGGLAGTVLGGIGTAMGGPIGGAIGTGIGGLFGGGGSGASNPGAYDASTWA